MSIVWTDEECRKRGLLTDRELLEQCDEVRRLAGEVRKIVWGELVTPPRRPGRAETLQALEAEAGIATSDSVTARATKMSAVLTTSRGAALYEEYVAPAEVRKAEIGWGFTSAGGPPALETK